MQTYSCRIFQQGRQIERLDVKSLKFAEKCCTNVLLTHALQSTNEQPRSEDSCSLKFYSLVSCIQLEHTDYTYLAPVFLFRNLVRLLDRRTLPLQEQSLSFSAV